MLYQQENQYLYNSACLLMHFWIEEQLYQCQQLGNFQYTLLLYLYKEAHSAQWQALLVQVHCSGMNSERTSDTLQVTVSFLLSKPLQNRILRLALLLAKFKLRMSRCERHHDQLDQKAPAFTPAKEHTPSTHRSNSILLLHITFLIFLILYVLTFDKPVRTGMRHRTSGTRLWYRSLTFSTRSTEGASVEI